MPITASATEAAYEAAQTQTETPCKPAAECGCASKSESGTCDTTHDDTPAENVAPETPEAGATEGETN